jgi:hypothetical protein
VIEHCRKRSLLLRTRGPGSAAIPEACPLSRDSQRQEGGRERPSGRNLLCFALPTARPRSPHHRVCAAERSPEKRTGEPGLCRESRPGENRVCSLLKPMHPIDRGKIPAVREWLLADITAGRASDRSWLCCRSRFAVAHTTPTKRDIPLRYLSTAKWRSSAILSLRESGVEHTVLTTTRSAGSSARMYLLVHGTCRVPRRLYNYEPSG